MSLPGTSLVPVYTSVRQRHLTEAFLRPKVDT